MTIPIKGGDITREAKQKVLCASQLPVAADGGCPSAANLQLPGAENSLPPTTEHEDGAEFKLSKRRWAILIGITVSGILNGYVNGLAPILLTIITLMKVSLDKYVYLSQMFYYITPVLAMPSAWFVDYFGLRTAVYTILLLTVLRNGSRALMFSPDLMYWPELRFVYWFVAGIFQMQIVIMYYCLPLKVSENWFPKEERSFAWSLMIAGPILGSAIASLSVPHYVTGVESVHILAYVNVGCLIVTLLAGGFGVTKSKPKHAPSERNLKSGNVDKQPMSQSIKALLLSPNILIQIITMGSFDAFMATIESLLQDVLASSGFSRVFCGQVLAAIAISSVVLQLISSRVGVDRAGSKGNTYMCKLYVLLQCFTFLLYAAALCLKNFNFLVNQQWWLVMGAALGYTFCRFWASPCYNNLVAHLIAGYISEAVVSAAGTITSSCLITLYTIIFVYLRRVDPKTNHPNYFYSILFLGAVALTVTVVYVTCFSGRKKPPRDRDLLTGGGATPDNGIATIANNANGANNANYANGNTNCNGDNAC